MNKDYWLLHETLETFQKIRSWVSPDFYREHIMPTVSKIKDRLAVIETEKFVRKTTNEIDTIPDQLDNLISNFGIFNETKKDI